MSFIEDTQLARSPQAKRALDKLSQLQADLKRQLSSLSNQEFEHIGWKRNKGAFGGGHRLISSKNDFFNQASLNISQIQYEQEPSRSLSSATALSSIIHPAHPHCPSVHIHISWTEFKQQAGYWRVMADLNPSIPYQEDQREFQTTLEEAGGKHYDQANENGLKYFDIPTLKRKRGVSHFYLESFATENVEADFNYACTFGKKIIQTYSNILKNRSKLQYSELDFNKQLAYHTLYFFQVTTLDRGTIAGILVHNENDVGIMGSLPQKISVSLLESWIDSMPKATKALVQKIIQCFPRNQDTVQLSNDLRVEIAETIRAFYKENPEAMNLLARGNVLPKSNTNHQPKLS